MKYIDIYELSDDEYKQVARVWEDGRCEGERTWVADIADCRRTDPVTGLLAQRGEGLLRRLASCYDDGYKAHTFGEAQVEMLPILLESVLH